MRWQQTQDFAMLPMCTVGPIRIISAEVKDDIKVPLATFETPLWPSVQRGARVCTRAGGIQAVIINECMTRSILVEARSILQAKVVIDGLQQKLVEIQEIAAATSNYIKLLRINHQIVGTLIFIRLEFTTGDASGHNMVTLAAEKILDFVLSIFKVDYVSVSGNYCTDKKASAVNGILGRGKYVVAEVILPSTLCEKYLKASPIAIHNLNIKKNLIGSIIAGGVRSANAHFANMLLGFYLATGQDAANIIEGSQGFTYSALQGEDLYFSVTLPNIIVGTVGNGKNIDFVQKNLQMLGCDGRAIVGYNARRLAIVAASVVLCGELSLLAAQTKHGELMRSHIKFERRKSTGV